MSSDRDTLLDLAELLSEIDYRAPTGPAIDLEVEAKRYAECSDEQLDAALTTFCDMAQSDELKALAIVVGEVHRRWRAALEGGQP